MSKFAKFASILRQVTVLLVFGIAASLAADNGVVVTNGSGVTLKTKDVGAGVQMSQVGLSDSTGALIYGTAGISNANVVSIQGIASGTAVPISGSVSVTGTGAFNLSQVNGVSVATAASGIAKVGLTDSSGIGITSTGQALDINIKSGGTQLAGSTTSGSGGSLVMCATTTSAPVNTTAQNNFFSCDTSGAIRVTQNIVDPCQNPAQAKSSVAIGISSATTTQLVALSGSTVIYVCGYSLTISQVATTANTIKFQYGTGAVCGTGTTDLTGVIGAGGITAGPPIVLAVPPSATIFKTTAGQALCAITAIGASASFQGVLTYVQI